MLLFLCSFHKSIHICFLANGQILVFKSRGKKIILLQVIIIKEYLTLLWTFEPVNSLTRKNTSQSSGVSMWTRPRGGQKDKPERKPWDLKEEGTGGLETVLGDAARSSQWKDEDGFWTLNECQRPRVCAVAVGERGPSQTALESAVSERESWENWRIAEVSKCSLWF